MKNWLYRLKAALLTIFGDVKVYPHPMWIVYAPDSFRVKGADTREAMRLIRPGDIVLRKYRHYLDGWFIPGTYSHTGVYAGGGKVVHAVAEGVVEIDLIDFLRCDAFAILRPRSGRTEAIQHLKQALGKPYDFNFKSNDERVYCHELAAEAYCELDVPQFRPKVFGVAVPLTKPVFLADSFLQSPDFTLIHECNPKRKEIIMKKTLAIVLATILVAACITGCNAVQSSAASCHNAAIAFAKKTSKAKAKEKIAELVEAKKITPEYGAELSVKADAEIDEIFAKIDELYERYKAAKTPAATESEAE